MMNTSEMLVRITAFSLGMPILLVVRFNRRKRLQISPTAMVFVTPQTGVSAEDIGPMKTAHLG
jgi:hypothetical protein